MMGQDALPAAELEYFIGLDLGSESMAACFQHRDANRPETIDLQARAQELKNWQPGMIPIDLLYEETANGRRVSHRLRTRISLREKRQPSPLPKEHAALRFESDYDRCLFNYFHLEGEALSSEYLIPNPKLLFQTGIRDVIPWIPGPDGWDVQYEPDELLAHMTIQVLNNLVLKANELEADARRRRHAHFDPRTAHLTITVPNVYSLTHIKRLEDFVRLHTDVGAVHTMYESDAIAHFMLGDLPGAPQDVAAMQKRIAEALSRRGRDASNCRVLTIDIGKGTTDLSLFNYDMNHQGGGSFTHDVLGRTGRSHGGARLSYILVEHLDERIQAVLDAMERSPDLPELVQQAIADKRSSVRLLKQPPRSAARGTILGAAENLVEAYKRGLDENYSLVPDVQLEPLAANLAQVICQEIGTASAVSLILASTDPSAGAVQAPGTPAPPSEEEEVRQAMELLQERLENAVSFPHDLPGGTHSSSSGLRRLFRRERNASAPPLAAADPAFLKLRQDLEDYVRQNVEDPLSWLIEMALLREQGDRRLRGRRIDSEETFVIVAGQASRFAPIQKAIRAQVASNLSISVEDHLLFLPDKLAKLACCFGAQWYFRAALSCNNPEEIMGTYSFLRRFAAYELVNLDMRTFNQKGETQQIELMKGQYWLVFQPRAPKGSRVPLEEVDRESMAFVRTFTFQNGGKVRVRYLGWGRSIEIAEGDQAFDPVEFEATFGNVGSDVDDVYRKTWPEAVRHE